MSSQSNQSLQSESKSQSNQIPWWVTSICIVTAVGAISYKFIIGDFNLDFNAFLSLVLALFSIFLSAMFYFKATDTSNKFYDNIYKFTKDIAELLVRIESSFGQQLKSIDERQSKMNDFVYNGKMSDQEIEKTENEIDQQLSELERIKIDQQKIINKLIEDAKIKEDEKERIKKELAENKKQYLQTKRALSSLQVKLQSNDELDRITSIKALFDSEPPEHLKDYSKKIILENIGTASLEASDILEKFNNIKLTLHPHYLRELESINYMRNGRLTMSGVNFYRNLIWELRYSADNIVDADYKD